MNFTLSAIAVSSVSAFFFRRQLTQLFGSFITNYRPIFICLFLLPISKIWELLWRIRTRYVTFMRPKHKHSDRVKKIQEQVKRWAKSGTSKPMVTGRSGWKTMSQKVGEFKDECSKIYIDLIDILEIDPIKKTVKVEPMANMGQVTAQLIPLGWTLAITPELDDLTVGGLLMGFGVESSSHKYGLFQDICESYEIILSDGSVVMVSATENSDLYYALPWSHGTLGFITCAEIKIVPAKRFVKLTYNPFHKKDEMLAFMNQLTTSEEARKQSPCEFIESLAFGNDLYVVMTGELSEKGEDGKDYPVNEIGRWWKPWFYTHARSFLEKGKSTELIPLRDYYHRHTRSIFWEMEFLVPFGNHPIFRFLMGWMLPPNVPLLKLTQTKTLEKLFRENFMFQDMLVPMEDLSESLSFFNDNYDIYPLWMCPHRVYNTEPNQGFLKPSKKINPGDYQMFIDIGAYAAPKKKFNHMIDMPKAEKFVRDHHGYQALYAHTYMTFEEFREMFDHTLYDQTRIKYNCLKAFPDVYDKVYGDKRSKEFNRNTNEKHAFK